MASAYKIYKYNPLTKLNQMLPDVRKEIIKELNNQESWRLFANTYAKAYELYELVPRIEQDTTENPGEILLSILDEDECDIEVFCLFLKECKLHKALLILQNPEPLHITIQPTSGNDNVIEMELGPLTLTCKAEGMPPPHYQWYHENHLINNGKSSDLNIDIESDLQEGKYICQVYQVNENNEIIYKLDSNAIVLKVKKTPISINKQPPEFLEIKQDETLFLDCKAISHPSPSYQWYKDGKKIDNQTGNKLIVHNFSPSKEGRYHCLITNNLEKVRTQSSLIMTYTDRETTTMKVALLIANQSYKNHSVLETPRIDVCRVAKVLKSLDFHVICLTDLTLVQMKNAIKIFCDFLLEGAYGFFYYAGHGCQTHFKYMWPIDLPLNYKHNDMLCENWLFSECLLKNPALLIVVLDMCLSVPDLNENSELPEIIEYRNNRNLLVAYSTSSHHWCYERAPSENFETYTSILCKYISQHLTVNKIFELVGKAFEEKIKGKQKFDQIPMYSSSVVKPFRLTDEILCDEQLIQIQNNLRRLIRLPLSWTVRLTDANIPFQVEISSAAEPIFNLIQLRVFDLDEEFRVKFDQLEQLDYNFVTTISPDRCVIQCPRDISGTIIINLLTSNRKNSLGAFALNLGRCIPLLEKLYKSTS